MKTEIARSNDKIKRKKLLGIDHGTATNQIKKELLFKYVKLANEHYCYRCGFEILYVKDFSVDHKIQWMSSATPRVSFFNLDNIAFSHLSCNNLAKTEKPVVIKHGSWSAYRKYKCKCELCRNYNRDRKRRQRLREKEKRLNKN